MPTFGLISWLNRKVADPLLQIIRRGTEPKQLASSTALGMTLGIFPIFGVPVFLCGIAIAVLRNHCHGPSVMLANFVATPIQISMVIPFLRLGEVICGGPHFPLTPDALKKVVTGQASRELLLAVAHAVIAWVIVAPFVVAVLYTVFVPCFKYLVQKLKPTPSSPSKQLPHDDLNIKIRNV